MQSRRAQRCLERTQAADIKQPPAEPALSATPPTYAGSYRAFLGSQFSNVRGHGIIHRRVAASLQVVCLGQQRPELLQPHIFLVWLADTLTHAVASLQLHAKLGARRGVAARSGGAGGSG